MLRHHFTRVTVIACAVLFALLAATRSANAQQLLTNGNLDRTQATEIVPTFFLPKPSSWVNQGFRAISGPYEDEMSAEPWAGPAPTPVTTDGLLNGAFPAGCDGPDCAVFFKAFSGNAANGPATGHLYQDVTATPGLLYTLTGWAGAESNFLGDAQLAIDFLNSAGAEIALSGAELNLRAAGLLTPNGQAFNYKRYEVSALAPEGAASVRARISMLNGVNNPAGGGQALVVDDFSLTAVPEPSIALILLPALALTRRRRHT